jgi:hypothetical protein
VTITAASPPNTRILKAEINSKVGRATFKFMAVGTASGFQCALAKKHRKPRFKKCKSPKTYKHLKTGRYTFDEGAQRRRRGSKPGEEDVQDQVGGSLDRTGAEGRSRGRPIASASRRERARERRRAHARSGRAPIVQPQARDTLSYAGEAGRWRTPRRTSLSSKPGARAAPPTRSHPRESGSAPGTARPRRQVGSRHPRKVSILL